VPEIYISLKGDDTESSTEQSQNNEAKSSRDLDPVWKEVVNNSDDQTAQYFKSPSTF
jgi:hypothetical protein